jgi:serine/threonine protein kinase
LQSTRPRVYPIRCKSGAPEYSFVHQLCDIAEGLNYLHFCNIVHGSIKGVRALRLIDSLADIVQTNILVDHFRRARIAEFAHAIVDRNKGPPTDTTETREHLTRWTAPETGRQPATKKSDVFSFAMVMLEASCSDCHTATSR